ncbi:MAG TPA: Hsp20/alpha crystallin family protein [Solirubrobacterales bacterium]|nr:Hsp20/alpha crystallin family protein [Solirubrobacterales bacterium]
MTTMLMDPFASWLEQGRRTTADPGPRAFTPPTDLLTGERDVKVVMDVPGLAVDDLEIELTDGTLTIRGERRYPYREHEDSHELNRLERGFGRFERILRVPRDVDPAAIEASIDAGVLTLTIPLPDSRRPHRIEVRGPRPDPIEVGESPAADGMRELAGAGA